jgi:hypothetical protein
MTKLKSTMPFFLLISACLAILTLGYVNKKPTCIESKDIQVISWFSTGQSVKIFSCNYAQDESSLQKMNFEKWKQIEFIESVAQSLEGLFFTLNKSYNSRPNKRSPYQVFIFDNQNKVARAVNNGIYISQDMFNRRTLTELFIKSWLQQKLPQLKAQLDLRFQMIVDFLLYSTGENYSVAENLNWLNGLVSIKSYCQSPWVLLDHLQTCSDNQSQDLSFFGMRPILFNNLVKGYKNISLSEQYYFLNNLLNKVSQYPKDERFDNQRSLSILDNYIEKYKSEEKFLSFLIPNYVSEEKFKLQYPSFIYIDSSLLTNDFFSNFNLKADAVFIDKQNDTVYLKNKSDLKFSLTAMPDKKVLNYVKAQNLVYITSTSPQPADLLKHKNSFDKVLNVIIKNSQDINALNLDSYLQKNIYEFMLANKNTNFYLYHLDSLALDEKYKFDDHLTSFTLNKTYNSYYSNSALDKIKWKRTVN